MVRPFDLLPAAVVTTSHAAAMRSCRDTAKGIQEGANELLRFVGTAHDLAELEEVFRVSLLIVERARASRSDLTFA